MEPQQPLQIANDEETKIVLIELATSTGMVVFTVLVHGAGLLFLTRILRLEAREEAAERITPMSARGIAATVAVILGLFVLHGIEIWSYAFRHRGGQRAAERGLFLDDHLWRHRL